MTKNSRLSFALAILILLMGAALRLIQLNELPPGLSTQEVTDLRLAQNVRQGNVQVFFDLGGEGRETLYPAVLATSGSLLGTGPVLYAALSFWAGMITLSIVFAVTRRLYGDLAGLGALSLLAFSWWPVLLSRMVGRETLLPLLVSVVLLCLALGLPAYWRHRGYNTQTAAFAGLGVAIAMGVYLHPAGIVVAVMALVMVLYYLLRGKPRPNDAMRRAIGFTLIVSLILIIPYLTSVLQTPGFSGWDRLVGGLTADSTPLPERAARALLSLGLTGEQNPQYNPPGRPLFDPISALILIFGVAVAIRSARKLRYTLLLVALVMLAPLSLLAPNNPSWLAISVLLPVLAMSYGLGLSALGGVLRQRRLAYAVALILAVFNAGWLVTTIYGDWARSPEVRSAYNARVAELAQHIDQTGDSVPTLICSGDVTEPGSRSGISNARLLTLLVHNPATIDRFLDCATGLIFVEGGANQELILPNRNRLSPIDPALERWLTLGTSNNRGDIISMMVENSLADQTGLFTTSAPVYPEPEVANADAPLLPPIRFENNLTFLGYEVPGDSFRPGGIVPVVSYWRVDGTLPADLILFAHVYTDMAAPPIANRDAISVVPQQLQARDIFMQVHYIQLPETLPPRGYTVAIGAYRQLSATRLSVLSEPDSQPLGTRLILFPIEVIAND
jgi:hypothetical protein